MLKRILKSVGKYKRYAIFTALFVIVEVIMEVAIPVLMANMIDYGIEKNNLEVVTRLGLVLIIMSLVSLMFGVLAGKFASIAASGFAKNLRKDIYYKVCEFSFLNIDKFKTSSLITRLTTDVTNVMQAFQMIIRVAVRAPMMLVFSVFMAFTINNKVPFIFVFAMIFLGLGLYLIVSKVHLLFKSTFRIYDKLNNIVCENLRGIKTVKSFVREDFESKKFENVSNDLSKNFMHAEKIIAFNAPLMQFSMYISILLIAWIGSKLIILNQMTRGELISLISYTSQILISLMIVSAILVMILISRTSQERIIEVLDCDIDLKNCDNPVEEIEDGSIVFKDVSFSYYNSENSCLSDVNIHIKSGESIGIIGKTGSSKSTLVHLIPRLYDVSSGEILVGGVNVKDYDIKTLRNSIAFVFQKNTLFSGTIRENLCIGNKNATHGEIVEACDIACANEFIDKLENKYDSVVKQEGNNFSGGQKQRLCIARAIIKKPKVLILDDSTSSVDTKTDAMIRNKLKNSLPSTTKIIISQRINSILELDRIIVMDNGRVVACGKHNELIENSSLYKEIYMSQIREDSES